MRLGTLLLIATVGYLVLRGAKQAAESIPKPPQPDVQ